MSELFDISTTSSLDVNNLVTGNEFDYVTRTSQNQGVLQSSGFVNGKKLNSSGNWSLGLMQKDFFYRKKPWYAGQFIRKITPKFDCSEGEALFFTVLLNQLKQKLAPVLVRNVDSVFLASSIRIPITEEGKIDFEFINNYISIIGLTHIRCVKQYLLSSDIRDENLTEKEQNYLMQIESGSISWGKYRLNDLFDKIQTNKLSYKAKDLPKHEDGDFSLPCLTSSFRNQGLSCYAPSKGATILKNVISLPSNSDVYRAYFQSRPFTVLSDAYAIRWKDIRVSDSSDANLFAVTCINKVTDLPIYSYKNKLGGWNVVKNKYILLPQRNGEIDVEFMSCCILAIKKIVTRQIHRYIAERLRADV